MTIAQKEARLNEYFASQNAAVMQARFLYLTDRHTRREWCSTVKLANAAKSGKLGSLVKRVDRTTFDELTKSYI